MASLCRTCGAQTGCGSWDCPWSRRCGCTGDNASPCLTSPPWREPSGHYPSWSPGGAAHTCDGSMSEWRQLRSVLLPTAQEALHHDRVGRGGVGVVLAEKLHQAWGHEVIHEVTGHGEMSDAMMRGDITMKCVVFYWSLLRSSMETFLESWDEAESLFSRRSSFSWAL